RGARPLLTLGGRNPNDTYAVFDDDLCPELSRRLDDAVENLLRHLGRRPLGNPVLRAWTRRDAQVHRIELHFRELTVFEMAGRQQRFHVFRLLQPGPEVFVHLAVADDGIGRTARRRGGRGLAGDRGRHDLRLEHEVRHAVEDRLALVDL